MTDLTEQMADLFHDTREHIEKNGWWRGNLVGPNKKQRCVMGGMYAVLGIDRCRDMSDLMSESCIFMMEVVNSKGRSKPVVGIYGQRAGLEPHMVGTVDEWNDYFAVDKQHVLDMLARCEKIARAGYDPDA